MKLRQIPRLIGLLIIAIAVLTTSVIPMDDPTEQARHFTRPYEFDYIAWTANAMQQKSGQSRLQILLRVKQDSQRQAVLRRAAGASSRRAARFPSAQRPPRAACPSSG